MSVDERAALVGLAALPSMGPRRLTSILDRYGAGEAFRLLAAGSRLTADVETNSLRDLFDRLRAQAAWIDPARLLADCEERQIAVLSRLDPVYPVALTIDPDPPPVLFAQGRLDALAARRVAVIGTRNATAAGRATASELGAALAANDIAVVSGLARGIDGAAHRGVRSKGGRAVAAVANGLDRPYPKQNTDIWNWIAANGLLLSEWPPGTPPEAWRFPLRNRIIAGLCEVLVVVESRESGGSLITAKQADERGVTIMAVPGSTRNRAATGTNRLLADGAVLVTCADDILIALGLDHSRYIEPSHSTGDVLSDDWARVLASCEERPSTLDMIVDELRIGVTDAAVALSRLEALGLVVDTGGWFESAGSRLSGSKTGAP